MFRGFVRVVLLTCNSVALVVAYTQKTPADNGDSFTLSTSHDSVHLSPLFSADDGMNLQSVLVWLQHLWTTMNPLYSPASTGVPFTNTKGIGYPGKLTLLTGNLSVITAGLRLYFCCCAPCFQLDSRWAMPPRLRRTLLASMQEQTRPSPVVSVHAYLT